MNSNQYMMHNGMLSSNSIYMINTQLIVYQYMMQHRMCSLIVECVLLL